MGVQIRRLACSVFYRRGLVHILCGLLFSLYLVYSALCISVAFFSPVFTVGQWEVAVVSSPPYMYTRLKQSRIILYLVHLFVYPLVY